VNIYGVANGSIVTPNTPLLTLEGPINQIQLIETTLINLTNYPSLIASLAYKLRILYPDIVLVEDGSQYGQSPNGSLSGCKYSYIGTVNSKV
jgi:nicotinic acid phosphoribosyltransferase